MTEKVQIYFEGFADEPSPMVVIYNSSILSPGLFRQIERFGLSKRMDKHALFTGRLQGSRKDLLGMIQSYGVGVEIVGATTAWKQSQGWPQ